MTTKREKQDGTMELDVGQIDLLDLKLPDSVRENQPEEPRVSKGPPPLPPSLPVVPSLPPPAPLTPRAPSPPEEAAAKPAISARTLVDGPKRPAGNPLTRFLIGMGGATLLCVAAFFVFRSMHKARPAPLAAPASASAAPVRAFTMAPIEFTSEVEPPGSVSAATSTAGAPSSGRVVPGGSRTATQTGTGKPPPRSDDVIKVEN